MLRASLLPRAAYDTRILDLWDFLELVLCPEV